jgi:WD40 repeat protein
MRRGRPNMSSLAVRIAPSASGTQSWARRSSRTIRTATRCSVLLCESFLECCALKRGLTRRRAHDNAKFVSCGGDRSVFVWDVASGQTIKRMSGHMGRVYAVDFNADATVVASGVYRCLSPGQPATDGISAGSYDATVRLWDLRYAWFRLAMTLLSIMCAPGRRTARPSRSLTKHATPCRRYTSAALSSCPVPSTVTSGCMTSAWASFARTSSGVRPSSLTPQL